MVFWISLQVLGPGGHLHFLVREVGQLEVLGVHKLGRKCGCLPCSAFQVHDDILLKLCEGGIVVAFFEAVALLFAREDALPLASATLSQFWR